MAGPPTFATPPGFLGIERREAGAAGKDTYEFMQGMGGTSTIVDFSAAEGDRVRLVGYGRNEVQAALQSAQTTATGTTITLSDSTKITFTDVSNLTKSSFS